MPRAQRTQIITTPTRGFCGRACPTSTTTGPSTILSGAREAPLASRLLISIVIPALNDAASLERLLPVLVARFPGADIVLVDGGSTDETDAIAERSPPRR